MVTIFDKKDKRVYFFIVFMNLLLPSLIVTSVFQLSGELWICVVLEMCQYLQISFGALGVTSLAVPQPVAPEWLLEPGPVLDLMELWLIAVDVLEDVRPPFKTSFATSTSLAHQQPLVRHLVTRTTRPSTILTTPSRCHFINILLAFF